MSRINTAPPPPRVKSYCAASQIRNWHKGNTLYTDLGGILEAGRAVVDAIDREVGHSLLQGVLKWVQLDVVIAIKRLELLNQVLNSIVMSLAADNAVATLRCIRDVLEILGMTKKTIYCDSILQSLLQLVDRLVSWSSVTRARD